MRELHRAGDAELREPPEVFGRQALRMLDPLPQATRRPFVLRRLERVERFAVRAVADRMYPDRPAGARRATNDLGELLAARDPHAGAVEHPGGLRAERAVHEHLQVAEPKEVVAEAGAESQRLELGKLLVRERLPDPECQPSVLAQPLEDLGSAYPAVLVVDGRDAAAVSELHACSRDLEPFVLGDGREPLAEAPRGFLAQHSGRLATRVTLDDSAFDLEISLRESERRRVQPQRVQVLRPERGRRVTRELVQRLLRGLSFPLRRAPALAAYPATSRLVGTYPLERLGERADAVEPQVTPAERPGREVDVRVREAGDDAAAAEIDHLGRGKGLFVDTDPAGDSLPRDRKCTCNRKRCVHGADDPVIEDHGPRL